MRSNEVERGHTRSHEDAKRVTHTDPPKCSKIDPNGPDRHQPRAASQPSDPNGPKTAKKLLFIRRFWSVGITRLTCRPWLVAVRTVGIDFDAFWGPVGSRTDFPLMFYCCFRVVAWSQHPWRGSVWAIRADHRFPLLVLHKINRTCTKNSLKSEPRFKSFI